MQWTWTHAMVAAGYATVCAATTQGNWISYNYTAASTPECRHLGETLWSQLMENFNIDCCDEPRGFANGKCDHCGGVVPPERVTISKEPLSTITRDTRMWGTEYKPTTPNERTV